MRVLSQQTSTRPRPRLVKPVEPPKRPIPWQKLGVYTLLVVTSLVVGMVPMWLKASQNAAERDAAQQELRLTRMENVLAGSVISAKRGDYEPARQTASDFFNAVRSQVDRGAGSDLSHAQLERVKFLLNNRDDIITLLARSDPAAADRLSDMYVAYRRAMNDVSSAETAIWAGSE